MPTTATYPPLLPKPFASNVASPTYGGKNTIPSAAASPAASLDDGFPIATMTPISAGGVAPEGKDFNGILNLITAFQAWANAGGRFKYDSTLATAISGYPLGAVLMLSDNVSEVICTISGTINDPNSNMTGWAPYAGALGGAGFYQLDTGAVNAYAVTRTPAISAYKNGMPVLFKAIHTNTGASTLDAGGGSIPLKRTDGAALLAGDVQNGSVYQAIYDAATTTFVLINFVQSQVARGSNSSYSINSSNSVGSPTLVGSSGVLSHGGGVDSNVDIYFTAQQACTVQVSANVFANGVDDAAPGGGQCGYLLRFLNGATPLVSTEVWLANNGVSITQDYNITQLVINTSGVGLANDSQMPATILSLAQGDVLRVNMNPAASASAWATTSWKFRANIVIL